MNWRVRMEDQRKLRKKGAGELFDRVKLLVEIFEDDEFTAWCDDQEIEPLDHLDAEVAEINASFLTLKEMLVLFPKRAEWQSSLSTLIAKAKELGNKQNAGDRGPRFSYKEECERLRKLLEQANHRINELEAMNKQMQELFRNLNKNAAA